MIPYVPNAECLKQGISDRHGKALNSQGGQVYGFRRCLILYALLLQGSLERLIADLLHG